MEVRNGDFQIHVAGGSVRDVRDDGGNRGLRRLARNAAKALARPANSANQFGRIRGTPSMSAPGPRGVPARLRISDEGIAALRAKRKRADADLK
jgi:hypothetical protein